jgi:hypothetical protein
MNIFLLALLALFSFPVAAIDTHYCAPAQEIGAEISRAEAVPLANLVGFDQNIAPFLSLRTRYPTDLFVHEHYQEAVWKYGIEGHLRVLTQEYQSLSMQHEGDLIYRYLAAHALMGRSTPAAIRNLTEILAEKPDFAPAHRALAEIYGAETFSDPHKEQAERARFMALCHGAGLTRRPGALPTMSPLMDQAEHMLAGNEDPRHIEELAIQAIREDEWRLQRIRPFDWYTVDFKRQKQEELQTEYWRLWALQVRCYRKANRVE